MVQILDALRHLPFCIQYMQQLSHPMVFRFCAIPQIMAIGTLAICYNNGKVFEGAPSGWGRRALLGLFLDSTEMMGVGSGSGAVSRMV